MHPCTPRVQNKCLHEGSWLEGGRGACDIKPYTAKRPGGLLGQRKGSRGACPARLPHPQAQGPRPQEGTRLVLIPNGGNRRRSTPRAGWGTLPPALLPAPPRGAGRARAPLCVFHSISSSSPGNPGALGAAAPLWLRGQESCLPPQRARARKLAGVARFPETAIAALVGGTTTEPHGSASLSLRPHLSHPGGTWAPPDPRAGRTRPGGVPARSLARR